MAYLKVLEKFSEIKDILLDKVNIINTLYNYKQ
jgi:hypothetical protein